jgi:hypothetical protein
VLLLWLCFVVLCLPCLRESAVVARRSEQAAAIDRGVGVGTRYQSKTQREGKRRQQQQQHSRPGDQLGAWWMLQQGRQGKGAVRTVIGQRPVALHWDRVHGWNECLHVPMPRKYQARTGARASARR